jgi:transposase InsO family protein
LTSFIDEVKVQYGVEPICDQLPISPSTYYEHKARLADPDRLPDRAKNDEALKPEIKRVWEENLRVYGARKIWRQLHRESIEAARCTVERLMRILEIQGVRRGKNCWTTIADDQLERPKDLVNREFMATRPDQLWVADITFCRSWAGWLYVAFIVDVFSRYIVGWQISRSLQTDLVMDALEQAIYSRSQTEGLIHHSDRGSQYLSIRYSERLAEAGIEASVGSVGDSYDNAMAETINGLYKAEVIHRRRSWKNIQEVEFATLEWVDWFNNRRLLEPIGDISPAEYEMLYYQQLEESAVAA